MKNVLTLCAIVLLCHFTIYAQDCFIDAGIDSRTCSYQDTLIGIPSGGTWSLLCEDTDKPISMNQLNDSVTLVTYSECGTYTFEYSISNDSCNVMDTVFVDFENPSSVTFSIYTDLKLEYQNIFCATGDSISCDNIYEVPGDAPAPFWYFSPYGSCFSKIYSTTLGDSIGACLVDTVNVSSSFHSAVMPSNSLDEYTQAQLMTLDDDNNIVIDSFFEYGDLSIVKGANLLNDSCALPLPFVFCHPAPPECLDTLLDTITLVIPIHLGGNWTVLENGNYVLLDSNNVFTIDTIDYWLNVTPSITDYNVTFSVLEITPDNDTVFINSPVSFTFLWEEKWTTDTISQVYEIIEAKDSCCSGGVSLIPDPPVFEIPPVPEYDCSPFTITFFPNLLASSPTIICEDSTYVVQVNLGGGIGPYSTSDSTGSINGELYTSNSIPLDSVYFSIDFMDSGGCEVTVEGDNCICLTGGNIGEFELLTTQDCGNDSLGKLIINYISGGTTPFLYSIDSMNFQVDSIFTNLEEGEYTLYIKDSFTCITTLPFFIGNTPWQFQASFDNDLEICGNENMLLELDINENVQDFYRVDWEDGDTALFKTINSAGVYKATVYELLSCTQYDAIFEVKDISDYFDRDIQIPNAFTPNGDGQNDNFAPYFRRDDLEYNSFNLKVFSRWGAPVFKTNDPNEEWLPEEKFTSDVYVWFLEMEIVMCDGEKIFYKKSGDLTLIR